MSGQVIITIIVIIIFNINQSSSMGRSSCLARSSSPLRSSFYMSGQVGSIVIAIKNIIIIKGSVGGIIITVVIIIFNINQSSSMGPPSAPHVWPGRCHRHHHQKHHHPFNMIIIIPSSIVNGDLCTAWVGSVKQINLNYILLS